jgi:hypothetical protein
LGSVVSGAQPLTLSIRCGDPRDVPFFEQPIETILRTAPPGDHPEPRPQDVARPPARVTDQVGLGNEAGAEELAQRGGIDRIGLDLGVRDGLEDLRLGRCRSIPSGPNSARSQYHRPVASTTA